MSLFVYYYMQQKDVLTELYSYISSDPKPPDLKQTECTLKYLEACNLLFENGLLSHNKVSSKERQVLLNIKEGYNFFSTWLDQVYRKGTMSCIIIIISMYHIRNAMFDSFLISVTFTMHDILVYLQIPDSRTQVQVRKHSYRGKVR